MVNETLHFIRGEVQQELPQRCDLSQMLADLTRRYVLLGKSVRWQGEADIALMCRPLAIKRALSNVIENALQYGGDAQLTLTQQPGLIRIEVLDHGAGLDAAQLEHACEPFVRFTDAPRAENAASGGLGLGLAIAQSNIYAHGGELILANRPPAGLCVTLILPDGIRS
jgi:signal transduction histidine kinase